MADEDPEPLPKQEWAQVDRAPVALALDAPDLATATAWAGAAAPFLAAVKVGLGPTCATAHTGAPDSGGGPADAGSVP